MADETWTVPEVYLLTEGPDGTIAVPALTLTFFADSVEVDKADGEEVWTRDWSQIAEMSPSGRSVLPSGGSGVVVTIVERAPRRPHRFVLGTGDPETTELFLRDLARAHGVATRRAGRSGVSADYGGARGGVRRGARGPAAVGGARRAPLTSDLRSGSGGPSRPPAVRPVTRSAARPTRVRRSGFRRTGGSARRGARIAAGGCPRD